MHLTGGILRRFRALPSPKQNPALEVVSTPAHPQVTQAVETVEKVPFQKLIFEKWEGNTKKRLVFGAPHNILVRFWLFFSLLWEIFWNIFRTTGFSTVSLALTEDELFMDNTIEIYVKQRESFLQTIIEKLSSDKRFAAAWLTGSFAKGEQDALSDIDLTLVVTDEHCQSLCTRPKIVSAQTTKERYQLFSMFGNPYLLHENNNNAPEGGTFTFVAYDQNAIMVDWILRPFSGAQRPEGVRLLFDKVNIPVQSPPQIESQEQRVDEASEIMAFFWMMAAVTVKYIYRGDDVFVNTWLEELAKLVSEVERRIKGQVWQYQRGSHTELRITPEEQITAIRQLCEQMENLKQEVSRLGGYVPESPMNTIETLIKFVQEKVGIQ